MSSILPKRPRLLEEPDPTNWFDLPFEMREMVIDRMDPETRCVFAQCSKLCEKEVKGSRNYLYSIGVHLRDHDREFIYPELCFSFSKESKRDFWYEFVDTRTNQTAVLYKCNTTPITEEGMVKWSKVEEGKPEDVRLEYLYDNLDKYENSIKSFHYYDEVTSWYYLGLDIRQLKHLKEVYVDGYVPRWQNGIEMEFIDMKQFSRINILNTLTMCFTFDQFLKFHGEWAYFNCNDDEFDEKELLKYLKMRKNGEIHENLRFLKMFDALLGNDVDIGYLMSELNGYDYSSGEKDTECFSFRSKTNREFYFQYKLKCNVKLCWKDTELLNPVG